jgi:hypothetical protein
MQPSEELDVELAHAPVLLVEAPEVEVADAGSLHCMQFEMLCGESEPQKTQLTTSHA